MDNFDRDLSPKLYSIEAEQMLLGGLLFDPNEIGEVSDLVGEDDFYSAENRIIFSELCALVDSGKQVDLFLVADRCKSRTGENYLPLITGLMESSSGAKNVLSYATMVLDRSVKRQVLRAGQDVCAMVTGISTESFEDVVDFAQSSISKINDRAESGSVVVSAAEVMREYVERLDQRMKSDDKIQGLSSGFEKIDELINGWKSGHLVIIAARPSMGKSTYALQLAKQSTVVDGKNGLFFSLEMPNDDLMEKLIACTGHIDLDLLQNPKNIKDNDFWSHLENAARRIKTSRLKLVHCPSIHVNQVKSYARKAHRREPLDFIFVDHIHLMGSNVQSRERQISEITAGLKGLAGELKIPVFALAQLNRKVEERPDKRPMMSDLRDSGSIEQDADIIQMLYRDDYYNDSDENPNKGLVQVDTVKHRNGKKGKVFLWNRYDQSRLEDSNNFMVVNPPPKGGRAYKKFEHSL